MAVFVRLWLMMKMMTMMSEKLFTAGDIVKRWLVSLGVIIMAALTRSFQLKLTTHGQSIALSETTD